MRLELTGRHVDSTPALRRLIETKLARLERMLKDGAVSAQVVLTREKRGCRADITLHARGEKFLHGVGDSPKWTTSVSRAVDKIVQQAKTVKGKWQERKRQSGPRRESRLGFGIASQGGGAGRGVGTAAPASRVPALPERPGRPLILRVSKQLLRSMSVTHAARAFESDRDGVVIFRDAETLAVSVLYRRNDGELTLVSTDA